MLAFSAPFLYKFQWKYLMHISTLIICYLD